jgi:hypothetical protein
MIASGREGARDSQQRERPVDTCSSRGRQRPAVAMRRHGFYALPVTDERA